MASFDKVTLPNGTTYDVTVKRLVNPVELAHASNTASFSVPNWDKYRYILIEYKPHANSDGQMWKSFLIPDNVLKGGDSVYYSSSYYWNFTCSISNGTLTISNDWTVGKYGTNNLTRTSFDVFVYGVGAK